MNYKRRLIALAVATIFAYSPAQAEEAERTLAPVKTTPDKEVDIQARTELGTLTEATPISGSVVVKEELEHLQLVNNLLELGKRVPGISMVRNMRIPAGGKQYTENRVDGMRAAVQVNTSVLDELDVANIERIEVITGPGSALYGSGALGGTISVFTRQPPRDFQARVSQEAGSWGFKRTQGNAGFSALDGRLGFIVTGSTMDNDGWRRNTAAANQDAAAEHKNGLAFKTMVRPTDSTKITLGYDELHYDYRWAGSLAMSKWASDWRQVEAGTYGQSVDDYQTQTFRLQQMLGERSEFSFGYARRTNDGVGYGGGGSGGANNVICDDTGALAAPLAAGTTVKCRAVNNNSAAYTNTLKTSNAVLESNTALFRHDFDLAKSTLYVGMEMLDINSKSATYKNAFNALQGQSGYWAQGAMTSTGQGSVVREKHQTPLIHVEFSPIDRLRFHLGQRFDRITYATDDRTLANKDVEKTYTGQVLKTGVTYDLGRNHLLWGNWSETFNAPASSTLLDTSAKGTAGNTIGADLKPEEGVTHELGFRGTFPDLRLHYDVALYHSSNKGFVVSRSCTAAEQAALNLGAACNINENSGELTAQGLESMYSWAALPWLDIGATYTYSQAYYNSYKTKTVDYSGNSYQAMPRHRLNLRIAVKPAAGWKIELEGDHISSYFYNDANEGTYSRPDLFSLRASYRAKEWSFWMHVLNLTDEKYATRVGMSTIAGQSNVLAASAGQGNAGSYTPLSLRLGLSYNF